MNLFRSKASLENDEQQLKNEIISTRVFICLLILSFVILLSYAAQTKVTKTVTFNLPTYELYSSLYNKYYQGLTCPCTNIAVPQEEFLSLKPNFHPICISDFTDARWSLGIYDAAKDVYTYNRDFRFRGPFMFDALISICSLAQSTINSSLTDFGQTALISSVLLSEDAFTEQINSNIYLFLTSLSNSFISSFRVVRDTTYGNGLVSNTLSSVSFRLIIDSSTTSNSSVGLITLRFKKYNNQTCSCHDTPTCQEQCYTYDPYTEVPIHSIPGLVIGCYTFEALLQSNFICFFNQTCVDELRQAIDFNDNFTTLAMNSSMLTKHQMDTNMENLMDDMMVEQWIEHMSYNDYFTQCRPIYCRYTYTKQFDILFIITTIIALIGGITTILQICIPRFVKLIRYIIAKRKQRRIQLH